MFSTIHHGFMVYYFYTTKRGSNSGTEQMSAYTKKKLEQEIQLFVVFILATCSFLLIIYFHSVATIMILAIEMNLRVVLVAFKQQQ